MEEKTDEILQVQGEKGQITMYKRGNLYYFRSDESMLAGLNEAELAFVDFAFGTDVYSSFQSCFEALKERYSIFYMWPNFIGKKYIDDVKMYFREYKLSHPGKEFDGWDDLNELS